MIKNIYRFSVMESQDPLTGTDLDWPGLLSASVEVQAGPAFRMQKSAQLV